VDNYDADEAISKHFGVDGAPTRVPRPAATERHGRDHSAPEPLTHLEPNHEVLELLGLSCEGLRGARRGLRAQGPYRRHFAHPRRDAHATSQHRTAEAAQIKSESRWIVIVALSTGSRNARRRARVHHFDYRTQRTRLLSRGETSTFFRCPRLSPITAANVA
jgi:hypothetical protein